MNKNKKALKHIRKAIEIQLFVEDGEDRALTLYCYGNILLALHAMKPDTLKAKRAETALKQSIENASLKDYGLDLYHPQIRLAQACLGSSPFEPGNNCESIANAESALKAVEVNFETLAPRSQCIFRFTESDFFKIKGDVKTAIKSAESALKIAKYNGFQTEVISVQNRLKNLNRPAEHHEVEALTDRQSDARPTLSHALGMSQTHLTRSHFHIQQNRSSLTRHVGSYRYLKKVRAAKYGKKVVAGKTTAATKRCGRAKVHNC